MPTWTVWCVLENEGGERIQRKAIDFEDSINLEGCKSDIATKLGYDLCSYEFEFYHESDRSTMVAEDIKISTIDSKAMSRLIVKVINLSVRRQKLLGKS